MPELPTDLQKTARDALYVSIGLGIIAFQKAQVRRVELTKQLKGQLGETRRRLGEH